MTIKARQTALESSGNSYAPVSPVERSDGRRQDANSVSAALSECGICVSAPPAASDGAAPSQKGAVFGALRNILENATFKNGEKNEMFTSIQITYPMYSKKSTCENYTQCHLHDHLQFIIYKPKHPYALWCWAAGKAKNPSSWIILGKQ